MTETMQDYEVARAELAKRIEARGWTLTAEPVADRPQRSKAEEEWSREAGHYRFTLRAPCGTTTHPAAHVYEGTYSVGVGILAKWAGENGPTSGLASLGSAWERKLFRAPLWNPGRLSVAQAEQLPAIRRAYRPYIVDVVGSMLSDVSGYQPESTLREWVDGSGMEWPHPADALEAFEAIREEYRFLTRALGAELPEWVDLAGRL